MSSPPNPTFSPRVVGTQRADFYSIDTLLASPQFAGKKGEALVLAIYDYFTSTVDGTYHFWSPGETRGIPRQRQRVDDPVKLMNAYGWMLCGQHAALQFAIFRAAGFQARQYGMPGHNLCEVFYDGRWHALDIDMWTWFRTPGGHIASATELQENAHALIVENKNKSNPCNLPDRTLKDYAGMYDEAKQTGFFEKNIQPPWSTRGHSMDFHLRPGETLIRSQTNEGRFLMPQEWKKSMQKFSSEWRGQPCERYEPFRTFGNGRWIYEPSLSSASRDVELGAWQHEELRQDENGLIAGRITFRIQSPYPFCGVPDWSSERIKYSYGVSVSTDGGAAQIEITDAEGNWVTVQPALMGEGCISCNVTDLLASRYECLVRISKTGHFPLRIFTFRGSILTAPLTLPRLIEGENPMELRFGDSHGQTTVPWTRIVDFRSDADIHAQFERIDNGEIKPFVSGWQMIEAKGGKPAQAVVRFDAPAGRSFASGYAEASIKERLPDSAAQTGTLEWSSDGQSWNTLSRVELTATQVQWDCSIDGECVPASPARSLWFRITTPTALSRFEFRGQLLEKPIENQELRITHRWQEDSGERQFQPPTGTSRYAVVCGKNPRLHSIEMSSPSLAR